MKLSVVFMRKACSKILKLRYDFAPTCASFVLAEFSGYSVECSALVELRQRQFLLCVLLA